ncbi:MAG: DegV family protein [Chloroflexi bacterium]|nr:DegV family protein [Chloroflexota bacterium]
MAVKVVTDSTSDLPPELASQLGVTVVPLNVHFGAQTFRDGVDLTAEEFFQRLISSPKPPTTSQPSIGAFASTYQRIIGEAEAIVSVHVSSRVSGTYNAALQASAEVKRDAPIEVVDTQQASLALSLIVLAAARAARQGGKLREVLAETQRAMEQVRCLVLVDTLEYLEKGGRIGKAQAFLGSLLQVKPILTVKDGEVHPVERVRTRQKALERLVELTQGRAPLQALAIGYSTTPGEAQTLSQRLQPLLPQGQPLIGRFGPVIGTYLGPGAIGVGLRSA